MPYVPDSILDSTKKILGLDSDYKHFDVDIIMHINSIFSQLTQLGVGPEDGFEIEDNSTLWSAYLGGNKKINLVKSYMYLKVRILFDPPTTSFDITAKQDQIKEFEFRINVAVQSEQFKYLPIPEETEEVPGEVEWADA